MKQTGVSPISLSIMQYLSKPNHQDRLTDPEETWTIYIHRLNQACSEHHFVL